MRTIVFFCVMEFPKCLFPRETSKGETSQLCNFPRGRLRHRRPERCGQNIQLGCGRLRNCTFGKLPLGKMPFGKVPNFFSSFSQGQVALEPKYLQYTCECRLFIPEQILDDHSNVLWFHCSPLYRIVIYRICRASVCSTHNSRTHSPFETTELIS